MNNNFFDKYLSICIGISILYILFYNILHYNPIQGYDGEAHHAYVQNFLNFYIPNRLNQPTSNLTYEFFSPPLPYFLPAFINEICKKFSNEDNLLQICQETYGFYNIIFQSILFLITLFLYIKIFRKITKSTSYNPSVFLLIGILTVNYKSIAMIRAETYILFFLSLLIYRLVLLVENNFNYKTKDILIFGFVIGGLMLSRQWSVFLLPGIIFMFFLIENKYKKSYSVFIFYSFMIGFLISGWFYINLYFDYGKITAFNLVSNGFSFKNQKIDFYIPQLSDLQNMFLKPIRPNFKNQFLPILYSDLWGDYWGYFSFTSRDLAKGRNQLLIGDYLARVNLVSLIPTFFLIFSFFITIKIFSIQKKSSSKYILFYVICSSIFSFLGYLWFLISYPVESGDTNKAVYIIQLFHLLGFLGVYTMELLKQKIPKIYKVMLVLLTFVFYNNFSALMSHFPLINFFSQ